MQNLNKKDLQQYSTSVFVYIASFLGIYGICFKKKKHIIFYQKEDFT